MSVASQIAEFIEEYLVPYGISEEDVEIDIDDTTDEDYFYVVLPNGLRIGRLGEEWFYNSYEDIDMDYILLSDEELDKIFKNCAKECQRKKKYKQLKQKNKNLLAEIATLKATIEEFQLRPGNVGYENAKKHFENLVGEQ